MLGWVYLACGMALAVVGNITVKQSDGYEKIGLGLFAMGCFIVANLFFGVAVKSLPLGIATIVWMGIVGLGVVIASHFVFKEHISLMAAVLMLVILGCSAALVVMVKGGSTG